MGTPFTNMTCKMKTPYYRHNVVVYNDVSLKRGLKNVIQLELEKLPRS